MRLLLLALLPTAIAFKLPRWLQRGAHGHHRPTISALEALLAEQKQTEAVLLERTKQLKTAVSRANSGRHAALATSYQSRDQQVSAAEKRAQAEIDAAQHRFAKDRTALLGSAVHRS